MYFGFFYNSNNNNNNNNNNNSSNNNNEILNFGNLSPYSAQFDFSHLENGDSFHAWPAEDATPNFHLDTQADQQQQQQQQQQQPELDMFGTFDMPTAYYAEDDLFNNAADNMADHA